MILKLLSLVAIVGKDGNGLNYETVGSIFSSSELCLGKIEKKCYDLISLLKFILISSS